MPEADLQSNHQQKFNAVESCPAGYKEIPLTTEYWKTEYDGYGQVVYQPEPQMISMAPQAARNPASTHASLVLSKFDLDSDNFDLLVEYKNVVALREENPNPWEVFWLFFNYVPGVAGNKTTNYVMAKPNGFELGTASQLVDQVFVRTSEEAKASFNEWHTMRVQMQDGIGKFYFNEKFVFDAASSALYTAKGKLGLYTEDASVIVKRVCVNSNVQLRE